MCFLVSIVMLDSFLDCCICFWYFFSNAGSSDFEESVAVIVAQYLPSLLFDVAPGTTLPMATEMVSLATNEKLKEMDWMKNIEICELVSRDPGYT